MGLSQQARFWIELATVVALATALWAGKPMVERPAMARAFPAQMR